MPTKFCRKCNTEKPTVAFGRDRGRHDGLQYQCRECRLAQRHANNEQIKATKRADYYKRREAILTKKRDEYVEKRDAKLAYQREYTERNKDALKRKSKQYYKNNPDYYKRYRAANQAKVRAKESKRRSAKLQRTPPWLTDDDFWLIEQAYDLAALRSKMFGFEWHVDHIIPLQAKLASGLHVPQNLQVIPASANTSKRNTFEV